MEQNKNPRLRSLLHCTGFIALFLTILTVLTLIFLPKWHGDAKEMRGFYEEEKNSIDVLMLGSCNMYSSYSPVIAYEQYGIVSYGFTCPDQELRTAYHYLVDALKTQSPRVVVLESLFLTCPPTAKREYYNRLALEYMPPSLNKMELILEMGAAESEYMQTIDSSAPGKLLTYAGYFVPLLRYHGRDDLSIDDVLYWTEDNNSSMYKGGIPLYSYLKNDTLDFVYVNNGDEVSDSAREYFIKIKELCAQEGIEFLLVKSPNHYRWDDEATAAVHALAAEQDVTLLDFFSYDDFLLSDYSSTTGRLNVYGMKKFTEHLCDFLVENYGIGPSELSETNKVKWDESVTYLHKTAADKGMPIDDNVIYRIMNETDGIRLLWNRCQDATQYSVYRCSGKDGSYVKLATVTGGTYLDRDVEPGQGYSYYIVPKEGSLKGTPSNTKYYVFVDAPTNGSIKMYGGALRMAWSSSEAGDNYQIQRKTCSSLNYESWDTTTRTTYNSSSWESGRAYDYVIRTKYVEDGVTYYSARLVLSAVPLTTPQISSVSSSSGKNVIQWKKLSGGNQIKIYRRAETEDSFTEYATVSASKTSFTDKSVTSGVQYFYKIVMTKTLYGIRGRSCDSNTVGVITRG